MSGFDRAGEEAREVAVVENLPPWGASAVPGILDAAAKGTAVLVLAAVVVRLGRWSAAVRHWVWFLALSGVLGLPVLGAVLPAWHVLPGWARPAQRSAQDGLNWMTERIDPTRHGLVNCHGTRMARVPTPLRGLLREG